MEVPTRYGKLKVTLHAQHRWQQRTGRSVWELIGAVLKARRPTKNQLRRIMLRLSRLFAFGWGLTLKKEKHYQPMSSETSKVRLACLPSVVARH